MPDAVKVFYEQRSEEEQKAAVAALQHHAYSVFPSPSPAQAWSEPAFGKGSGRCVYVRCHKDEAVPLAVQDIFHGASEEAVGWTIENLEEAGHSPFITHLDETVGIVDKYASKWTQ